MIEKLKIVLKIIDKIYKYDELVGWEIKLEEQL